MERSVYEVRLHDTTYLVTAMSATDALGVAMMTDAGQWPVSAEPEGGYLGEGLEFFDWAVSPMSEEVARSTMYEEEERGTESLWDAHLLAENSYAIACSEW